MKKLSLLLLLTLLFTQQIVLAQVMSKSNVAVYVTGNLDDSNQKIVSSKAVSRISRSDEYIAIERTDAFLQVLQKEQDYQVSGNVTDDQIAELGKQSGVKYVAVFEYNKLEDSSCFVSARLIDVSTAVILKSVDANRQIKTTDDLIALTNNISYRLISKGSK